MSEDSVTVAAATAASKPGFASAPSDGAAHPLPRVMGRLMLLKLLARGGMGDVYLAATTGLEGAERACVVKTVRRDHIHDGSFLARFLDEARVQSQLNHPGVAQVLEAATDEQGEPFTVVEYIEGRSLADVRQRALQSGTKIGWADAVAIAIEMAQALAHVHDRTGVDGVPLGIVHRDLSPQNVMIGYGGEVKLIDFGTARGQNRRCHTVAGVVFAKPGYVAPEIARQEVGDGRIDVYALGVMLWELCKGGRLLVGDPQRHLEDAAAGLTIIPPVARSASAPAALDEVIAKLTANDPTRRYGSAALAVADLASLLTGAPETKNGERGVRARVANLMRSLWPQEPMRSRGEFARLLKEARASMHAPQSTPVSAKAEDIAARLKDEGSADPNIVSGTPYRIVRKIGEGASGLVYEAEHTELGRRVALKVLAPGHSSAHDAIERFRAEARAVARLSHPNLVPLYDFGKSLDGRVFLAMELLQGETLDKRIRRTGGMDYREAIELATEACKALEAAHGAGLVHRDLKPANLFLTRGGGLKLLDFGVAMALADVAPVKAEADVAPAKVGGDQPERKQKGFAIFGTPEYMAPEQVAGEAVDGRCDIYALGCVLYELITGTPVFEGRSSVVVMGKQLREIPESLRARAPHRGVPPELDALVLRALDKDPAKRFASATVLREALAAVLALPVRRRATTKRRAWSSMGVVLALAGGVFLATRVVPVGGAVAARTVSTPAPSAPSVTSPAPAAEPSPDVRAAVAPVVSPAAPAVAVASVPASLTSPLAPPTDPAPADGALAESASRHPEHGAPREVTHAERERALREAREAAKDSLGDARALKAWAVAAYKAGAFREARRAADAWILVESTPEPHILLAEILEGLGHRAEARAVLAEVLDSHPESTQARRLAARYGNPSNAPETASQKSQVARR
jgi:serine/threonine-protein kinase